MINTCHFPHRPGFQLLIILSYFTLVLWRSSIFFNQSLKSSFCSPTGGLKSGRRSAWAYQGIIPRRGSPPGAVGTAHTHHASLNIAAVLCAHQVHWANEELKGSFEFKWSRTTNVLVSPVSSRLFYQHAYGLLLIGKKKKTWTVWMN